MKKLLFTLLLAVACFINNFAQDKTAEADKILGVWVTGTGNAHIKITKYGESKYGGKIVWLREPKNTDGTVKLDIKNPDETKKKNAIMGLNNLLGFTYSGNKEYDGGTIYDPKNGKTYKCVMTLVNDNQLNVRGYVGFTLLGRTEEWKRVVE